MNYREKAKQANQQSEQRIKLPIVRHVEVRENETGEPCFSWYDKEKEETIYSSKPIIGFMLHADAMKISSFDQNYGKSGGMVRSTYYWKNTDQVALFDSSGEAIFKGDVKSAIDNLATKGITVKKKRCLLVKTAEGIFDISTNLIISIEQINALKKENGVDVMIDNTVKLTPKTYNPKEITLSKKSLEYLGKFIVKNPPKYVGIEVYKPVTDEIAAKLQLDQEMDLVLAWLESNRGKEVEVPVKKEETNTTISNVSNDYKKVADNENENPFEMKDDDLPF